MKSIVAEKSYSFAVRIVKLYRHLTAKKSEFVLSKQVLRSGTSVGANVREGQDAQSKADFASKMSIALKECGETLYWLDLLHDTDYITVNQYRSLADDCIELKKLLTSIVKTSRSRLSPHSPLSTHHSQLSTLMNEAQVRHDLIDPALKAAGCALLRKVILMESVV